MLGRSQCPSQRRGSRCHQGSPRTRRGHRRDHPDRRGERRSHTPPLRLAEYHPSVLLKRPNGQEISPPCLAPPVTRLEAHADKAAAEWNLDRWRQASHGSHTREPPPTTTDQRRPTRLWGHDAQRGFGHAYTDCTPPATPQTTGCRCGRPTVVRCDCYQSG